MKPRVPGHTHTVKLLVTRLTMQTPSNLRRFCFLSLLGFVALSGCAAAAPEDDSEPTHSRRRQSRTQFNEYDDEAPQSGSEADPNAAAADNGAGATVVEPGSTGGNPCQPGGADGTGGPGGNLESRAGGPTASIGTPAAGATQETPLVPHWRVVEGHGRIVCEGALERACPYCPQCPAAPTNAAIVHTFAPIEREVLECEPPSNAEGRLAVRVNFTGAGMPVAISFPGVHLRRRIAMCMGEAFCRTRMPTLRSAEVTVSYEYVVLLPATPQAQ